MPCLKNGESVKLCKLFISPTLNWWRLSVHPLEVKVCGTQSEKYRNCPPPHLLKRWPKKLFICVYHFTSHFLGSDKETRYLFKTHNDPVLATYTVQWLLHQHRYPLVNCRWYSLSLPRYRKSSRVTLKRPNCCPGGIKGAKASPGQADKRSHQATDQAINLRAKGGHFGTWPWIKTAE